MLNQENRSVLGVKLNSYTLDEAINRIESFIIDRKKSNLVVLANVHTLNFGYKDGYVHEVLTNSDFLLRDGAGLAWAMRKKGVDPMHNFVGTDFIPDFFRLSDRKYKVFLVGYEEGVVERAGEVIEKKYPNIEFVGGYHGYFGEEEDDKVVAMINSSNADMLLIGMGNPKQEVWGYKNRDKLSVPAIIGVGALLKYMLSEHKRAPRWMLNHGLEWVYRLFTEPKRMWKRYLVGNSKFIWRVCREDVKGRFVFINILGSFVWNVFTLFFQILKKEKD